MDSALYSLGESLLDSRIGQQHAKGALEHMATDQHRRRHQALFRDKMPPAPPIAGTPAAPARAADVGAGGVKDEL